MMNNESRNNKRSEAFMKRKSRVGNTDYNRTKRMMLMATRIADAMASKGWRPIDLAQAMGKQPSQVTEWLSGTRNFEMNTLSDISDVLGVDLQRLDEPKKSPMLMVVCTTTTASINESEDIRFRTLLSKEAAQFPHLNISLEQTAAVN